MTLQQIKALAKNTEARKMRNGRYELYHIDGKMPLLYESFGSAKAAKLKYELVLMQNISS